MELLHHESSRCRPFIYQLFERVHHLRGTLPGAQASVPQVLIKHSRVVRDILRVASGILSSTDRQDHHIIIKVLYDAVSVLGYALSCYRQYIGVASVKDLDLRSSHEYLTVIGDIMTIVDHNHSVLPPSVLEELVTRASVIYDFVDALATSKRSKRSTQGKDYEEFKSCLDDLGTAVIAAAMKTF